MAVTDAAGAAASAGVRRSLWQQDRGAAPGRPALSGHVRADVVIVGAGFTGLWTAYYLLKAQPSLKVVILEREYAGFGASGRNGGWASSIFPVSLARVAKIYGHAAALHLQSAMNDTVTEIGDVVANEGIACDYARQGYISLARNPAQMARARATVAGAQAFGIGDQWRLLDAGQARDYVNASGVLGGIFTDHCALLQPDRLVRGLAESVERLGAVIYENTAVKDIDQGVAYTADGAAAAAVAVRATEAYTPQFRRFRHDVAPLYSLIVATAPIPEPLRAQLNLTGRTAFNDMRNLRIYAHPTVDGRLVFGGRGAPYHFGSRVGAQFDVNTRTHRKIVAAMHDMFPQLRSVAVTHKWGGPLGVPRDWFPSVGYEPAAKLAWAGPYVGDGVATSNLAGRILRNLLLNKSDCLNTLPMVNHRSRRWEVEPLRWLGVNAGLQAATVADIEEGILGTPSKISALLENLTGAH